MRKRMRAVLCAVLALAAFVLAGCGDAGLDRVDVTWRTDPPPRWGLYPGYRQEIPCPVGAEYHVDVFRKGAPFTGGTLTAAYALSFVPDPGARGIAAVRDGRDRMTVTVTLRDDKGGSQALTALRIERVAGKIYFEFPK
ncbi:hypothetical protein SAMN04488503_1752 [Humidesulfovibrio mexicanus]|uniref:Lipoprotein n=1 Tax=Humidesulfovibrio mexicanus TaxID=147047 RepID=A0A239A103_9BACT|nr:hypothetical protein [Humidesulfovibrio mexicanus]SNR89220.1 hypothetical protein SAMN04488503_1752 [Humidesulfovibrio mexicanus]